MGGSCRENIKPRDDAACKVNRWIRGKTKISQVLKEAVSYHQGRYGIEIMFNFFFGDGTCSWVMLVNGKNKCVTEMSGETKEKRTDDIGDSTGKPVAKARPKQRPRPTSPSPTVTFPYHQRKWINEKKTEQSNSEPWHRCFIQNLRILRTGQFERG